MASGQIPPMGLGTSGAPVRKGSMRSLTALETGNTAQNCDTEEMGPGAA